MTPSYVVLAKHYTDWEGPDEAGDTEAQSEETDDFILGAYPSEDEASKWAVQYWNNHVVKAQDDEAEDSRGGPLDGIFIFRTGDGPAEPSPCVGEINLGTGEYERRPE